MKRVKFDAIITLPSDNTTTLMSSLMILNKYSMKVNLLTNEDGRVWYKTKINNDFIDKITEEDLTKLKNASWKLDEDFLIKDM